MQITRDTEQPNLMIESYQPHELVVDKKTYHHSVIVTPNNVEAWPPKFFSELNQAHIELLLKKQPEVVLIGTGEEQRFPSDKLLEPLIKHQIGIEVMSTLSACYTFRILAAEGRNVIAGLIV